MNSFYNTSKQSVKGLLLFRYRDATAAAAAAKSLQSCPTLCDPIDGSLNYSNTLSVGQVIL